MQKLQEKVCCHYHLLEVTLCPDCDVAVWIFDIASEIAGQCIQPDMASKISGQCIEQAVIYWRKCPSSVFGALF